MNPCIVGDMFEQQKRGRAIAVMGMTPYMASTLGPIVGGFISQAKGGRWTFWLVAIIAGTFEVGFLLLHRESYRVTILAKKAQRLRKKTGNARLHTPYDADISTSKALLQSAIIFISLGQSKCGKMAEMPKAELD